MNQEKYQNLVDVLFKLYQAERELKAYLMDKQITLENRWRVFEQAGRLLEIFPYNWQSSVLKNAGITLGYNQDIDVDECKTILFTDLIDYVVQLIQDGFDESVVDKAKSVDIKALKEECLSTGLYGFVYS